MTDSQNPRAELLPSLHALVGEIDVTDIQLTFAINFLDGWLQDEGEEVSRHWNVVKSALLSRAATTQAVDERPGNKCPRGWGDFNRDELIDLVEILSAQCKTPPSQPVAPVVPDDLAERFAAVHSLEPELNRLVYEALCKRPRTAGAAATIIAQYPAQPSSEHGICPNCVSPWKCNGPHIGERPPSGYEDAPIQAQEPTAADWRKAIAASLEHSGRNQLANGAIDWIENRAREIARERK